MKTWLGARLAVGICTCILVQRTSLSTTRLTSYYSLAETSLAEGIRLVNLERNAYFSRAHFSFYLSHILITIRCTIV